MEAYCVHFKRRDTHSVMLTIATKVAKTWEADLILLLLGRHEPLFRELSFRLTTTKHGAETWAHAYVFTVHNLTRDAELAKIIEEFNLLLDDQLRAYWHSRGRSWPDTDILIQPTAAE